MQQYIGKNLGGYRIIEQVGQGGMATVFKAYQPSMDRYVAIKILASHFTADETFLARFTREARTLARLEHPHILPVHDYGEQDGITYLVMRYCEAGTLKDLISRNHPLPSQEVTRILGQVGRALDYAHSQGVIHRDIKPSNVLINQQGDVFLTDFGIAKLVVESAQFTATGAIVGTPAYMSPEQGMGQPVDHRTDIYSLGVVLYELVTGQVPYEAETPLAVLLKHVNEPLPMPRQIKPDLPPALERVILKAMAKSPDDRFQSAQGMIDALSEAAAEALTEVLPPPAPNVAQADSAPIPGPSTTPAPATEAAPPPQQAVALARRRRPWRFVAGGVVLLALLVIAGLLLFGNGQDAEPTPAVPSQTTPVASTEPAALSTQVQALTPSGPGPGQAQATTGWTNYDNGNFVYSLARQDDTLWAGGDGGLVRWSLTDGSYVEFGPDDGLASNRIHDLLVDREGILWIATDAGIGRYDGQTFTIYDDADGLDVPWTQVLFQDENGGLWAGSHGERGLNYYNGERWGPPPIPPLPLEYANVRDIVGNDQEGLFVGLEDQGLAHFDGESWTILTADDGLPAVGVLDLLLTDDALWASFDPSVVRFDLATGDRDTILEAGIYAMHQTAGGEMWFGGDWRAIRFDPGSGDWQEFETDPGPIPGWQVRDIVESETGLWLGTYGGGLAFYDGTNWEPWSADAGVGGNWIEAIRQDGDGGIWFTHPGSGLSRYDSGQDTWQVFAEVDGALDWPSLPGVDSQGHLWIGDYGELLYYDGLGWQAFRAPELEDVSFYAIEFGPGDITWLVTDRGLVRHDPANDEWTTFTEADHPILGEIWSILAASDGTLWIGGEEGIVHYDGLSWSSPEASGSAPEFVDDIAESPDGSLWAAADGELAHLSADRWSYLSWPSDGWLETVTIGPDGGVWAGYEGLARFNPESRDWHYFSPDDGLAHIIVRSIHVTPDGVVWVGTEAGISRYVPPAE
jgi:ligand-binding sensor domain-containing protein